MSSAKNKITIGGTHFVIYTGQPVP